MSDSENTRVTGGFRTKIENFWYHYKWHSIVSVFVIIAVLVCSLQMCSKEKFDAYIMYAGGYAVSQVEDGDVAEYVKLHSSFKKVVPDNDGNGEVNPSFLNLYTPTEEEMKNAGSGSHNLIREDFSRLEYELVSGSEYYICLLSSANYDKYKVFGEVSLFTPLADLVPDGCEAEYYDEGAIYLHSLPFSELDGIRNLPEDTVISLRKLSAVASVFDKGSNTRNREYAEKILINILTYSK